MSTTHSVLGSYSRPQIVGSIHALDQLPPSNKIQEYCDIVEFRLDALAKESAQAVESAIQLVAEELPVLITARCPSEGGMHNLTSSQRASLYQRFSKHASLFDTEIASTTEMSEVIELLKSDGLQLILSAHDFQRTPAPSHIREQIDLAHHRGADIAKFAVFHQSLTDLHSMAHLMQDCFQTPVALMGMGDLAPVSRVLLAQLGSVLNYGYLGNEPTAPGQWPAKLLKEAILHSKTFI